MLAECLAVVFGTDGDHCCVCARQACYVFARAKYSLVKIIRLLFSRASIVISIVTTVAFEFDASRCPIVVPVAREL